MNFSILIDYPVWLVLLCLLCGMAYSLMLYFRNPAGDTGSRLKILLAIFRFVAVSIVALLLLGPIVERRGQHIEDPYIVFLQDNSGSLLLAEDSGYYDDVYLPAMESFLETMSEGYQPQLYTFGESFSPAGDIDFSGRLTNMSQALVEVNNRYSNRNIGAVVIAGDGLYNRGANPYYTAISYNFPVYTVALGDTLPRRDLIVKRVNHNQISYLGNTFPVEVEIEAIQAAGQESRLSVIREGTEIEGRNIIIESEHHIDNIVFYLEADQAGMQQYTAELTPLEGEVSIENNSLDFFIDVIDGRQQVLVLANSPHPDVGAIKEALLGGDQYEVEVMLADEFDGNAGVYDLVVLHQLPSGDNDIRQLYEQAREESVSLMFVLGKQTDLRQFNDLAAGLQVDLLSDEFNESLPVFNQAFGRFTLSSPTRAITEYLPPLYSPFGNYSAEAGSHILYFQRIGAVSTEDPLILFSETGEIRTGVIAGEGLWRWRIHSFMRQDDHFAFDDMLSRIVQYLSLSEDRRRFRVHTDVLVDEGEPVLFEAELYNPSFELVNEPEVELVIINEEGVEYQFNMGRTTNSYRLDAGVFEPGRYSWEASVVFAGENFTDSGIFNITPLDLEGLTTIADHGLLNRIAASTGGSMYYPDQFDQLREDIVSRDDIRPRIYSGKDYGEIINIKALFFIILLLLGLEWFLRKRSGAY